MNEALSLAPQNVGSVGLDGLLALVGFPSKRKVGAGELAPSVEGALKDIFTLLDEMLLRCIGAQTKEEFVNTRQEVFRGYARGVTSLASLVHLVVPPKVVERVSDESFCELESEFREQGLTRFGEQVRDQAMFTVWTLRRTSRLIGKISVAGDSPAEKRSTDEAFASNFIFYTTWTQFHLDCLLAAIRFDKSVQMAVLPEIIDGLRAAVNAYGFARQGLDLRSPGIEPNITPQVWDEEDQELLNSSMREMEREFVGEWQPVEDVVTSQVCAAEPESHKPVEIVKTTPHKESPIFGTHIREGIEIVKDWIESRKQ